MAIKSARKSTSSGTKSRRRRRSKQTLRQSMFSCASAPPLFLRFLARQAVEYSPRAPKFREALFFLAKFAGVRHQAATGTPGWVLHVQHLVKQHIFHCELRHARAIHSPVQQNVIRTRIVAAELPPPASIAPANVWTL